MAMTRKLVRRRNGVVTNITPSKYGRCSICGDEKEKSQRGVDWCRACEKELNSAPFMVRSVNGNVRELRA